LPDPPPGSTLSAYDLGFVPYDEASTLQESLSQQRELGHGADTLLLLQHLPVITIGQDGGREDILASSALLEKLGIACYPTDRGGKATYHGPGQLVAYPILRLPPDGDLHAYVYGLEEVARLVLAEFGIKAERDESYPGLWVGDNKIAAVGLAVRHGVIRHGLSLNASPNMEHYRYLVPCGIHKRGVTSLEQEMGQRPTMADVTRSFAATFADVFGRRLRWSDPLALFSRQLGPNEHSTRQAVLDIDGLLSDAHLNTVCSNAQCPNICECYGRGTATFLLLGDTCTRGCRFCAVNHGEPHDLDPLEPQRLAQAASAMRLRHVVVTSVTRDDLPDGGAGHFAQVIHHLRERLPDCIVEVLIADFRGSCSAVDALLLARPDVLNHNMETVPRLYPSVRHGANFHRSLALLSYAKSSRPGLTTKSGLMLGLGERPEEVRQTLLDLRRARCDLLTLGQYLQPTEQQLPVSRYLHPAEFNWYRRTALSMGFQAVAAGPLVRSSYRAAELFSQVATQ